MVLSISFELISKRYMILLIARIFVDLINSVRMCVIKTFNEVRNGNYYSEKFEGSFDLKKKKVIPIHKF